MPATRAAAQRAEAQRVALLAAASNADTQPLSHELVDIVIQQLPRSQLASARLVSKQFAAAVDPLISAVSISLTSWDKRVALVGLQHVTRLDVGSEVKGLGHCPAPPWRQLQHITSQLPKLNTLRFLSAVEAFPVAFATALSSLSSLTRLDIARLRGLNTVPHGVQLPGLKAASFARCRNLADIVAFAPNLEHLNCHYLEVGGDRPAALPSCTHFAGKALITTHTDPAHAFAAAFPNLQVVTGMPQVFHGTQQLSAQRLLAHLPSVCAVRGGADELALDGGGLQVQRLCLYGSRLTNALEFSSISRTSQLQHVRITSLHAGHKEPQVRALAALPQLQSLVLPAGLLCSRCCLVLRSSLQSLAAKSSLKQLVFLEWQQTHCRGSETGCYCTNPVAIQAGLQSIAAAAAAAAASTQEHQSQQQQQLNILHQREHQKAMPRAVEANPDSVAGVWGVYGPPGKW